MGCRVGCGSCGGMVGAEKEQVQRPDPGFEGAGRWGLVSRFAGRREPKTQIFG